MRVAIKRLANQSSAGTARSRRGIKRAPRIRRRPLASARACARVYVTDLPIYLRRGEGECKIRIPTDGSNLRPQAVNTWASGGGRDARRRGGGAGREGSAPDLTILRPRGVPPMEKLRSEYSTLFFWTCES